MKTRTTTRYAHAVQIQPRNGQELHEIQNHTMDARDWTPADHRRFPQATRQLCPGWKLVVDRKTALVYAVPK